MKERLCAKFTQYGEKWQIKEQSNVKLAKMRQVQKNMLLVNVSQNFGKRSLQCFYVKIGNFVLVRERLCKFVQESTSNLKNLREHIKMT